MSHYITHLIAEEDKEKDESKDEENDEEETEEEGGECMRYSIEDVPVSNVPDEIKIIYLDLLDE